MFGIDADWKALILCLVGASTFWFFNAMNDDHTSNLQYPVVFRYDNTELVPTGDVPDKIPVNATGYGWDLFRLSLGLNRKPVIVEMELFKSKSYITARNLLPVLKEQLDDIRINYILEDTVYLPFDNIVEKTFVLKARKNSIDVEPSYEVVGDVRISPDTVTLRGAESKLREMGDTLLVDVPGERLTEDFSDSVDLDLEVGPLVQAEKEKVQISFDIEPFKTETRQIDLLLQGFPEDTSIIPVKDYVVVTFKVHPDDLQRFREQQLTVVLPYSKMNPQDSTIAPVLVNPPQYVENIQVTPSRIRIIHE